MNFIRQLLNKKSNSPQKEIQTVPLDPQVLRRGYIPDGRRHIYVGTAQSTGIERSHNEDAILTIFGNSGGHNPLPDFGIFVVADGMGGHRLGELASALTARTVAKLLTKGSLLYLLDLYPSDDIPPLHEIIRSALQEANEVIVERVPGGGTTCTAAVLLGEQVTIGHVGDSRAYIIQDGEARSVTRDHSLVERLYELGQLTQEEAAIHPQRNVLYRAIGQGANLEVDVTTYPAPRGGFLLICSDGLWGVVENSVMERIIYEAPNPQAACDNLVQAANQAGGPDNISAVLVHFPPG